MITIRHVDRTCLREDALRKFCEFYSGILRIRKDIIVSFDKRIKDYGDHCLGDDGVHLIRISPKKNKKPEKIRLGPDAEKYNLIASIVHELFHAYQSEHYPYYEDDSFNSVPEISNPSYSDYFSLLEVEARIFEHSQVLVAVRVYDRYCE